MNRRDWSDALGERLRSAEVSPSSNVWERVELSADSINRPYRRIDIMKWTAAVAAIVVAGVVAINTLYAPSEDVTPIDTLATSTSISIEESETIETIVTESVIDMSSGDINDFIHPAINPDQDVVVAVSDMVVVESAAAAVDEPIDIEQRTNTQPKEEARESKNAPIIEMPMRRRGVRNGGENMLALNFGGGVNKANSGGISTPKAIPMSVLSPFGAPQTSFIDSYRASDIKHHQPINVTLSFSHNISGRWSIVSGVGYTALISDVKKANNDSSITQRLNFIGTPIRFDYNITGNDRFCLYSGLGAQGEYCLSARVGEVSIDECKWHLSTNMVIGGEYRVIEWFSLYCEPELSYYLTDTTLNTYRNENPLSFTMRFGVRFTL